MLDKALSYIKAILCCNCFGFINRQNPQRVTPAIYNSTLSQGLLLDSDFDDEDSFFNDEITNYSSGEDNEEQIRPKRSEDILDFRVENGMICRQFPVKETHKVVRTEVNWDEKLFLYIYKFMFVFLVLNVIFLHVSSYLNGYFYNFVQDEDGNKMINEYVREYKIGSGSYGKVVSIVFTVHCPSRKTVF